MLLPFPQELIDKTGKKSLVCISFLYLMGCVPIVIVMKGPYNLRYGLYT